MDVFRRIFGKFQHLGTTISRTAPRGKSLNLRLQNSLFFCCMWRTILRHFLTVDCVVFDCFLRKFWFLEKIYSKYVRAWETKRLPWDRERGNEVVWQTVKPWELRGLILLFDKRALGLTRRIGGRSYSPHIGSCFLHFWYKLRQGFFQKGHCLIKCQILSCFISLK